VAGVAVLLLFAISPGGASGRRPLGSRRPGPSTSLAVLRDGVVWVDEGRILFQGFRSGQVTLGGPVESAAPILAASNTAVAMVGAGAGFAGGVPPGRLAPVEGADEEAREWAGGECSLWSPAAGASDDFAVADGELVDAGECSATNGGFEEQELATAQPLFVHRLRGGGWRVLRWMKGHQPPVLATEGDLLAIGDPVSAERMRVTILDLATGSLVAQFRAPLGGLSFASSRRLVLSVTLPAHYAMSSRNAKGTEVILVPAIRHRLELYTLHGRPLAYIGTVGETALVSHMHLLLEEEVEGHSALVVRNILDGSTRRLIGLDEPARALEAVGFRWPAVAVVETTRVLRAQSEVTCDSGEYRQPSPPALRIFDLERREAYVPSPPSADLAPPPRRCPKVRSTEAKG
jgi:hypothetical protein